MNPTNHLMSMMIPRFLGSKYLFKQHNHPLDDHVFSIEFLQSRSKFQSSCYPFLIHLDPLDISPTKNPLWIMPAARGGGIIVIRSLSNRIPHHLPGSGAIKLSLGRFFDSHFRKERVQKSPVSDSLLQ
jgi:hypothetical protein